MGDNKKIIQDVVRTYPNSHDNGKYYELKRFLNNGYVVKMCNKINCGNYDFLEYIVEKEVDNDNS